ncbi:MAG: 16S rRNA (guanine(527)-N(7))-methyltransferase RsmG [Candidatus Kerfeldbacteria bacterium]|nr:16S rRNA (guanine(527)-N(7))-methyltransferase RsmG [Candidatus Kerfeldbacteria bacterium]
MPSVQQQCTPQQWQLLLRFIAVVKSWNTKINLISRRDVDHIMEHHVMPCLLFKQLHRLHDHETIIDIGSGGGFPGVINAIVFPTSQFVLVDATQKKVKALQDICATLGLHNTEIVWARIEHLATRSDYQARFDHTTSRAVAPLATLVSWSQPLLKSGGTVEALKGGNLATEIAAVSQPVKQYRVTPSAALVIASVMV